MSYTLQNQVDQNAKEGCFYKSIYETVVMRALASHANDNGGSCYPCLETLAAQSQCSRRTLQRVLKQFKKRGWITIEVGGGRCSNRYQILAHGWVVPATVPAPSGTGLTPEPCHADTAPVSDRHRSSATLTPHSYHIVSSETTHHIPQSRERERQESEALSVSLSAGGLPQKGLRSNNGNGSEPASYSKSATSGELQNDEDAVEDDEDDEPAPPAGMPTVAQILAFTRKLRLPDDDGYYIGNVWLTTGFRTSSGVPIRNYRAVMRYWYQRGWFPSQDPSGNF